MSSNMEQLTRSRDVAIARQNLLEACRRILSGEDSPGRRRLLGHLRYEAEDKPLEHIAVACHAYLTAQIDTIRDILISEFRELVLQSGA